MPQRVLSEQEFNAIRDQVLQKLPNGLSEDDFHRAVGPLMAAAIGEAENSPKPVEGSTIGRFVSNAWDALNPIAAVKGIAQAVQHPQETLSNIGQQMSEQYGQAKTALNQGRYAEALGHGVGVVPLVGPAAVQAGEQIAGGDIAGGLGRAAGLLAPFGAAPALKVAGRAAAAVPEAAKGAIAGALERGAAARVEDVIAPKVGPNKLRFGGMAEDVAPELAKNPAMASWSRSGLHSKIETGLAQAESALDAAADARLSARSFATKPVIEALEAKKRALMAEPVEASHSMPVIAGEAVRETPINPLQRYALQWMKDEMESFPFTKHTFNEIPKGAGGSMEIVPGSAGAPVYRGIIGAEGRELVSASRGDVIQAIKDALEGKPGRGKLDELVAKFADDLAQGRGGERFMNTPGPIPEANPPTSHIRTLSGQQAAEIPPRVGQPIGKAVLPAPNALRAAQIDQAISELKQLGPVARYESLRRIRQAYDQPAKAIYNPSMTQDFMAKMGEKQGAADVTGVLRENLAKFDPATATANADYSFYRKVNDVLEATAEVERTRPKVGRQIMTRLTATLAGEHAAGVPGAVAGFVFAPIVDAALSSGMTTKLQTASLLSRLSQAIRRGDLGAVNGLTARLKQMSAATLTDQATSPSESRSQTTAPAGMRP